MASPFSILGEPASSELFLSKEKYAKKRAPDFAGALSELPGNQ